MSLNILIKLKVGDYVHIECSGPYGISKRRIGHLGTVFGVGLTIERDKIGSRTETFCLTHS